MVSGTEASYRYKYFSTFLRWHAISRDRCQSTTLIALSLSLEKQVEKVFEILSGGRLSLIKETRCTTFAIVYTWSEYGREIQMYQKKYVYQ